MANDYLSTILAVQDQRKVTGRSALTPDQIEAAFQGELNARYQATVNESKYNRSQSLAEKSEAAREKEIAANIDYQNRNLAFQDENSRRNYNLALDELETQKSLGEKQTIISGVGAVGQLGLGYAAANNAGLFGTGTVGVGAGAGEAGTVVSGYNMGAGGASTMAEAPATGIVAGGSMTAAAGWGAAAGYAGGKVAQPVGEAINLGGKKERGAVGGAAAGALAGAAATSWSGPGAIVGAIVGGIVGFVSNSSWICTEIDKLIGLSYSEREILSILRRYALKHHNAKTRFYLKSGNRLIDSMKDEDDFASLIINAKRDMVNICVRFILNNKMEKAYQVYDDYTTALMKKYNKVLYSEIPQEVK